MTATLDLIRAGIKAELELVPGIGQVHAHERYMRHVSELKRLYLSEGPDGEPELRGWWFRRKSTTERSMMARVQRTHVWELRGYMAFRDDDANPSELRFDALIEAMTERFRANPTLGGACDPAPSDDDDGLQLIETGPVMFCDVLCHAAVLQLITWESL